MSVDARILMAQHAKTAQLMGVDFLPLGTVPVELVDHQPEAHADPSPDLVQMPRPRHPVSTPDSQALPAPIECQSLRACWARLDSKQAQLDAIQDRYQADAPHQHFNTRFTNIVFGEGDANADLMFVGEAPGEQEDLTGRPFVGRAGQLLEKMIVAMGQSRESVYIANVLKTRPPNNATPTSQEAALCEPYLMEQIRVIDPKVIVTLGLPATQLLLKVSSPMRSMRGQWHRLPVQAGGGDLGHIEVMPTYHPAYLLRSYTEENRRKVWSDLTQVIEKLKA